MAVMFVVSACGTTASPTGSHEASAEPIGESSPEANVEPDFDASPDVLRAALAQENWWHPVLFVDCDAPDTTAAGCVGQSIPGVYEALPVADVSQQWNICVVIPHLKDTYWLAFNYGLVEEATRDNAKMQLYAAGGYTELATQVNQLDDCAAQGADAILVGAISYEGLNAKIEELTEQGIVIVDVLNGISSPAVQAHTLLDYRDVGRIAGDFLLGLEEPLSVAWFPGPPGAGWPEAMDAGLTDAIAGSQVEVVATQFGETGKEVQLSLVEDTLQAHPETNFILGTGVTAEAAPIALAERGQSGEVGVMATYITPVVFDLIRLGDVSCSVTDHPVVVARMAVDMAIRMLEERPMAEGYRRAAPVPGVVCGPAAGSADNVDQFLIEGSFAPVDFTPTFNVN